MTNAFVNHLMMCKRCYARSDNYCEMGMAFKKESEFQYELEVQANVIAERIAKIEYVEARKAEVKKFSDNPNFEELQRLIRIKYQEIKGYKRNEFRKIRT